MPDLLSLTINAAGGWWWFSRHSPYNYLVDPGVREIMGINLKDAVVIFDEVRENRADSSLTSFEASLDLGTPTARALHYCT